MNIHESAIRDIEIALKKFQQTCKKIGSPDETKKEGAQNAQKAIEEIKKRIKPAA